ncbi:hypothetical protein ACFY5C_40375 [Streptomyces sp. NPDC012935]|uniref:hypothetical protein n=1 Tax=Streptomyces sp. NPDC012935 TaxID=3364857 RepID=UPI0036A24F92
MGAVDVTEGGPAFGAGSLISGRSSLHPQVAVLVVALVALPGVHGYARAGIPVYLLIDCEEGEVTVHSEPSGDAYTKRARHRVG